MLRRSEDQKIRKGLVTGMNKKEPVNVESHPGVKSTMHPSAERPFAAGEKNS
jgi:hypothetical protein